VKVDAVHRADMATVRFQKPFRIGKSFWSL
jgi:hypothetical protein